MLVVILAVNSAAGLYYYLRIVAAQFAEGGERICPSPPPMAASAGMIIAVLTFILFWLGIYPATMIRIISVAMPGRI
jgi:NADH-quinone oxidoreductase subunit N